MRANIKNRTIFCRDNLDVLRGINGDSIDLIYLDPPFNKNKVFSAAAGKAEGASFSDIFRQKDVKEEWLQKIAEDYFAIDKLLAAVKGIEGRASYNFCYLAYMAIRLVECRRILKPTGSLYLHCDPTMSHHLKLLLDCIFGEGNFRNEIVWAYRTGGATKTRFSRKHDIVFCYSKNEKLCYFQTQKERVYYEKPFFSAKKDAKGRFYADVIMTDWWADIKPLINVSAERAGYPTQKPLALLERIIAASSKKGDTVLDPFCGSATTCVAAEKMGRKWAGIDISVKAYELVKKRLAKEAKREKTPFYGERVTFATNPPKRADQGAGAQSQK